MITEKFDSGKILIQDADLDSECITSVQAIAKIGPKLINGIDEGIWNKRWKDAADKSGFCYIMGQNRFDKNFGCNFTKRKDINGDVENLQGLMGSYCESASRYNKQVADPFIAERSGLMDRIIGE